MKKERGFTLIEMAVVVSIVGILAAIAIPVYQNYKKKADVKAAEAILQQFTALIPEYQAQHGRMCPKCNEITPTGRPHKYEGDGIKGIFPKFTFGSVPYTYKVEFTVTQGGNGTFDESATYTATPDDEHKNDPIYETLIHTLR